MLQRKNINSLFNVSQDLKTAKNELWHISLLYEKEK